MSDYTNFEKVFCIDGEIDPQFDFPITWNGGDFFAVLKERLDDYCKRCTEQLGKDHELTEKVNGVSKQVQTIVREYLHGFPSKAYENTEKLMEELKKNWMGYELSYDASLYRTAKVKENREYDRERIFHVPYNMRSKMPTYRYSIPGYPGLYLSDSLDLAREETEIYSINEKAISARFEPNHEFFTLSKVKLLNLGDRPKDIYEKKDEAESKASSASLTDNGRTEPDDYILWYPVLVACSYIRTDRESKFSPEYIVPQLLTQWLRIENLTNSVGFVGIRYFSCKTRRAAELGRNYFFPSSGDPILQLGKDGKIFEKPFCPMLNEAFKVTKPYFTLDYSKFEVLEKDLKGEKDLAQVCTPSRESFADAEKIEFPDFCQHIGYNAFSECKKIPTINIPDTILSIGDFSFYGCTGITNISIGKNVSYIASTAFAGCSAVEEIRIAEGNETYYISHVQTGLIIKRSGEDKGKLVSAVTGSRKNIVIPNTVTSIGDFAFSSCQSLTAVTIPNSVTSIEDWAFWVCKSLTAITIPDSVTRIGDNAFSLCKSLTAITVPDSVTSIGNCAFSSCKSLTAITIPNSVTSIGFWAFLACDSLKQITYSGTMLQFQAIDGISRACIPDDVTIKCSDGQLTVNPDGSFSFLEEASVSV